MLVSLCITSKDINSLKNFLKILNNWLKIPSLQIVFHKKQFSKNNTKRKFTVLKSPHVNKKSGEKIELFLYQKKLYFYSFNNKKLFIVIKGLTNNVVSGVKIKIRFIFDKYKIRKVKKDFFNPDCYFLKNRLNMKYLKIFDIFGENSFNLLKIK
nr:ribosomal protein S10 [Paralia sulcata]